MAWSKTTRISIMLGLDTVFFLLELTVGLMVGSLALMADAFHMVSTPESLKDWRASRIANSRFFTT